MPQNRDTYHAECNGDRRGFRRLRENPRGVCGVAMHPFSWLLTAWLLLQGLKSTDGNSHLYSYDPNSDNKNEKVSSLICWSMFTLIAIPLSMIIFMLFLMGGDLLFFLLLFVSVIPMLSVHALSYLIFENLYQRNIRHRSLVNGLIFVTCGIYCVLSTWWVMKIFGKGDDGILYGMEDFSENIKYCFYRLSGLVGISNPYERWFIASHWLAFCSLNPLIFAMFISGFFNYKMEMSKKKKEKNAPSKKHKGGKS